MQRLLETLGIEPGRFRLEWVSASEGDRFAEIATDFTNQLKALGPNPLGAKDAGVLKKCAN